MTMAKWAERLLAGIAVIALGSSLAACGNEKNTVSGNSFDLAEPIRNHDSTEKAGRTKTRTGAANGGFHQSV